MDSRPTAIVREPSTTVTLPGDQPEKGVHAMRYVFSVVIVFFLLLLTLTSHGVLLAAEEPFPQIDVERLGRAMEFLGRFSDSACVQNKGCSSWLAETKYNLFEIERTLSEIRDVAVYIDGLQRRVDTLKQELVRENSYLVPLRRKNIQTAFDVLRQANFGLPGASASEAIEKQLQLKDNWQDAGNRRTIFTLFGYFSYTREVSLKEGPRDVKLVFQPYLFARGTDLGNAYKEYLKQAKISISPELKAADESSIDIEPEMQVARDLDPINPAEWRWTLKQRSLSSLSEGEGRINVAIYSAGTWAKPPALEFHILGRPWWTLFKWLWENIFRIGTLIGFMLGAIVVYLRRGIGGLLKWIQGLVSGTERQG